MSRKAFYASILHFIEDPDTVGEMQSYEYFEDGVLIIEDGIVTAVGDSTELAAQTRCHEIFDYRDQLLLPGLIDTHIHFPQTEIIASYGKNLLSWLEKLNFRLDSEASSSSLFLSRK